MSSTQRLPIVGKNPPCADKHRLEVRQQQKAAARAERKKKPDRPEEFICYDDSDDEEDDAIANEFMDHQILRTSYNFVDFIRNREIGLKGVQKFEKHYSSRHILTHDMFKEHPISLNNMNKVFCSQWLSDRQIVFGTKCNKLLVYDIHTQSLDHIPTIASRDTPPEPEEHQSGIHFLQMNPSRSLLVTGATHSHQLAIYRLPTLDPIAIAEKGHKDWVFDAVWLDDEYLVSGSRDSKLGLWHVGDESMQAYTNLPLYGSLEPIRLKVVKNAQKIRSLAFNRTRRELACLSLNGYIHVWSVENFKQSLSRRLPSSQENVCLAVKEDGSIYAIGCRSYTLLLDSRTLQPIRKINARYSGCGIRSASFQDNTLTIGTGIGMLMFYDLRANRYLESSINASRTVVLKTSRGFVFPDEEFADQGFHQMKYTPAIYTHCYDHSNTRLFAAGGPLPASMFGNYAGIWQ